MTQTRYQATKDDDGRECWSWEIFVSLGAGHHDTTDPECLLAGGYARTMGEAENDAGAWLAANPGASAEVADRVMELHWPSRIKTLSPINETSVRGSASGKEVRAEG